MSGGIVQNLSPPDKCCLLVLPFCEHRSFSVFGGGGLRDISQPHGVLCFVFRGVMGVIPGVIFTALGIACMRARERDTGCIKKSGWSYFCAMFAIERRYFGISWAFMGVRGYDT